MYTFKISPIITIGVAIGFVVGIVDGSLEISSHHHIKYGMFQLAITALQSSLNAWLLYAASVSIGLFLLIMIARFIANRFLLPPPAILQSLYKWVHNYNLFFSAAALVVILAIFIFNLYSVLGRKINQRAGPNVVLIVVDTLRADYLSNYGYHLNTTPNIDNLSADSVIFKNAISSAPWTSPAIASILTGQYPGTLGYIVNPGFVYLVINKKFITLAELFKSYNYATKAIISHDLVSDSLGFGQGFDSFDQENAKGQGHVSSPSITQKAINFLVKNRNKKFFLFLHYFDPHYDFIMHDKYNYYTNYKGKVYSGQPYLDLLNQVPSMSADDILYIKMLYNSEISFTDEYIGNVIKYLKNEGLYDNTLIVLTADHGEEFSERGNYYIGHQKTLYQELLHVPLMIKFPYSKHKKEITTFVETIDLMATICKYADIEIPDEYAHSSMVLDVDNDQDVNSREIFSETITPHKRLQSVIKNDWKYIYNLQNGTKQLFNLRNDKAELSNLVLKNPKISNDLEIVRRKINRKIVADVIENDKQAVFTEEVREKLKTLGYVE